MSARRRGRGRLWVQLSGAAGLGVLLLLASCEAATHRHARTGAEAQTYSSPAPGFAAEPTDWFGEPGARRSTTRSPLGAADEVWVIARPGESVRGADGSGVGPEELTLRELAAGLGDDPIDGTIIAQQEDRPLSDFIDPCGGIVGIPIERTSRAPQLVPMPLEHTDVNAQISGYIASVEVTQQYHNPYDSKIEAVYIFPLPQDGAVSEFIMTVGERRIRGIIREREEAEKIYQDARSQGYVASLLTQQRPNIFTQRIANIEPQRSIDVSIRYFHTLPYLDGWYSFTFPMVVGPRFNPSDWGDPINAVARGTGRGAHSGGTDIEYLRPHERSGHDISLSIELEAGVDIEALECRSHAIESQRLHTTAAMITLSEYDSIPNKDFVLRWRVGGDALKADLMTHRDPSEPADAGYFTLMLYPPADISTIERNPIELIFVLDCSGSMEGEPLAIARRAAEEALRAMQQRDTFSIIRFSEEASTFGPETLPATRENIERGLRYLDRLAAGGGTHMLRGVEAALDLRSASDPRYEGEQPDRDRYIVFLTDGFIGNEAEVLNLISRGVNGSDRVGDTRVFSFGIGSSPNAFLLERMAQLGRGAVAYVGLNDSPQEIMRLFTERIAHPALADISIDYGGLAADDVFPQKVPDLFAGRPVVLAGRFRGEAPTTVRVNGRIGGRDVSIPIDVTFDDQELTASSHEGIAKIWARTQIADLTNRAIAQNPHDYAGEIQALALRHGLMSAYTAFIAVDASRRTEGDYGTTVPVAVPVPDGVRYETTVDESG